jgi:terminase small subunit-like protein
LAEGAGLRHLKPPIAAGAVLEAAQRIRAGHPVAPEHRDTIAELILDSVRETDAAVRRGQAAPSRAQDEISSETQDPGVWNPPKLDRHEVFCPAYVSLGFRAAKAATAAGYSARSAHVTASRLLRKAKVQSRIAELKKQHCADLTMDARELIARASVIARADGVDLFDDNGTMRNLQDIPAHTRMAIESWQTELVFKKLDGDKEEATPIAIRTVKFASKIQALALLARLYGLDNQPPAAPPPPVRGDPIEVARRLAFIFTRAAADEAKVVK